jgi:hypothetical protein
MEGIPLVAGRMRKDLFGSVEHSSTCFRDSLRQARIVRFQNGRLIKLFPFVGTRRYYIQQIHNELPARKRQFGAEVTGLTCLRLESNARPTDWIAEAL